MLVSLHINRDFLFGKEVGSIPAEGTLTFLIGEQDSRANDHPANRQSAVRLRRNIESSTNVAAGPPNGSRLTSAAKTVAYIERENYCPLQMIAAIVTRKPTPLRAAGALLCIGRMLLRKISINKDGKRNRQQSAVRDYATKSDEALL